MRKYKNSLGNVLVFSLLLCFNSFSQLPENRCATGTYLQLKSKNNPKFLAKYNNFNKKVEQVILKKQGNKFAKINKISELIRIPVVVHVIHNNLDATIGGTRNSNISDDQIKSQIEVLNEDYRRKINTKGFNTNTLGTDMNIEFYLADTDPNGSVSNGILRVYNQKTSFDPFSDSDQQLMSSLSYWPSDCYLNIWITTLANNYLGYSQFPSAPDFDGLDSNSDEKIDGVYIDYKFFGRNAPAITSRYYKHGRTTTHEIGHWLGLIHTWGDEDCGDDYVTDTPVAQGPNLTVVCNEKFSTCQGPRTRNMIENYMDYTIDSCMNIFTIGQLERVKAVFEVSPRRKKLLECVTRLPESETLEMIITPNPASQFLKGNLLFKGISFVNFTIFDGLGKMVFEQAIADKRSFTFTIPIANLPKGLYYIKANTTTQATTKRILIE